MKQRVVTDGKEEVPTHIERGGFLLYPEDEWRKRGRPIELKAQLFFVAFFSIFLIFPAIIFIGNWVMFGEPVISRDTLWWWVFTGLILSAMVIFILFIRYSFTSVVPALYEKGVQTQARLFVPYEEIDRVKVQEAKVFFSWTDVMLVSSSETNADTATKRWSFPFPILGSKGLVHLQVLVGDVPGKEDPPELHVYHPRKGLQGKG